MPAPNPFRQEILNAVNLLIQQGLLAAETQFDLWVKRRGQMLPIPKGFSERDYATELVWVRLWVPNPLDMTVPLSRPAFIDCKELFIAAGPRPLIQGLRPD